MNTPTTKRLFYLILILSTASLTACGGQIAYGQGNPNDLVVFAAASLTDAFTEMADSFEARHPTTNLILNFASSSQLAAQLREGVAADVFASANEVQMQVAIDNGRVDPTEVETFAANRVTILVPAGNPAAIRSLEDLGNPGIRLLMAVEGVPVRAYADQVIDTFPAPVRNRIYANLVSEESNVRQVSTKVALGEADAGIAYVSDITPDIADRVEQVRIPEALNVTAAYPIAVVMDSSQKELALDFIEFVRSEAGQVILAKWGFLPIHNDADPTR